LLIANYNPCHASHRRAKIIENKKAKRSHRWAEYVIEGKIKMAYNRNFKKYATPVIVKMPRVIRAWSDYQKAIFNNIENGIGNTQVDALAGTGKTSTLVEGFYYVPKGLSTLFVAFNKSIQVELESRAPEGTTVKTLHGLGYTAVRRAFPRITQPDQNKLRNFVIAEVGDDNNYEMRTMIEKCVSLSKGYLAEEATAIDEIMDRHDVDTGEMCREQFILIVRKVMNACKMCTSSIDFDDMIWFPNIHNLKLDQFDRVFIDEAQDLNPAQINLGLNATNGRILSCGDQFQSIYGWRGADSNAINNIVNRLSSKRLPLSMTYRCAKSIVALAKTLVPEIECPSSAEDGLVADIGIKQLVDMVKPGDFVLSRTNAPLLKWCLYLLKNHISANIQGRDVGANLISLIKKSHKSDVDGFLDWLHEYAEIEINRMQKRERDSSIISDKVECMEVLCEGMRTLAEVKNNIVKLFSDGDDKSRVIFSTTHKAKGLERDRVFMLRDTYRPSKSQEEANLTYVAYTRAKKELYLVSGK
jgi:DNA helicase-2/ATP-dependent DNA helicase PcrA